MRLSSPRYLSLSQGEVSFLGPPLDVGPLPALIYFTMSHRDSLLQSPYNQVLIPLAGSPFRVFSWDLPYHPVGIDPNAGIEAWKEAHHRGENFLSPFIERSLSHLEDLKNLSAFIEGNVVVSGLSRGAFSAMLLAASSDLIDGVLAFAPMVKFHDYSLMELTQPLSKKWIHGFVSFQDERIDTNLVIDLFKAMNTQAKHQKIKDPKIELTLYPSIGYKGHGTPEEIFIRGGQAILKRLSP